MLLSYAITSRSDPKNYFAASLSPGGASARQSYFSEGQESPGIFLGKLADDWGIAGKTVEEQMFHRLCDNLHPVTGKKLKPRNNDFSRIAYDFTISGPKSFSIVEALAPTEAERRNLRRVFDESVAELVSGYMEPDMQCRERRGGANHDITTGNMLVTAFPHATARPADGSTPDPHWHYHLLIWNLTKREDGKILAGQFGNLVRDKPYYRAVFYSLLAKKLEGLGYVIDRRGDVDWEIAGITQEMIDTFSKRTSQIEDVARERGITDEGRKAELGAETRVDKQKELTLAELREAWWSQLTDDERDALARVYARQVAGGTEVTPAEAVGYALAHCSEKLSVIPERELKRVALLFGLGSVTPEEIDQEMLSPKHGLVTDVIDGRRMVTTEALREEEWAMAGYAADGRGKVLPVMPGGPAEGLTRELEGGKQLNDEQFQAVTDLLTSPNRVNMVQGPAGAGKSSLLKKYDEGMRLAGQGVTYLGTTAAAVGVLQKDGFADTKTVAHFLMSDKLQAAARGGRVVVDETSLLGHKEALKLIEAGKKNNLKFVFIGDPMQHGSVGRGAFMRLLTQKGLTEPIRLTRIMRQKDPAYRAAAQLLSEGKTTEGFDALDKMGWIKEMPDDQRHAAMASDYVQARQFGMAWNDLLVVAPTHREAAAITQAIRSGLRECGKLEGDDHQFTRLVEVDTSVAQRGQKYTYRVGDVIQFHQKAVGHEKGERMVITDPAQVPLSEAGKFSLYRQEKIGLAVGDVIRFTGTVKTRDGQHVLRNGAAHKIAGFTEGGNIRLDNGWLVSKDAGHFRHGFVETSIGSQGRTVRRVLLGMPIAAGLALNMQQLYVSASRAWESLLVYTDAKGEVREAAQRDSRQLLALDLKPAALPRGGDGELLRHLERERRLALLDKPFRYVANAVLGRRPPTPPAPAPAPAPTHAGRVRASQQHQQGPRL